MVDDLYDDDDDEIVEDDDEIVNDDVEEDDKQDDVEDDVEEDDDKEEEEDDDKKAEDKKEAKKRTQQEKIDFAFSKKQKQLQEEKKLRLEAEEKIAKYKQELQKFQKPKRPEIPEMPDMLDPKYEQKLQLREETIKHQVMYDQRMRFQQHQHKQAQLNKQQTEAAELKQMTEAYAERSVNFGIKDEDAKRYEDSIATFVTPKDAPVVKYLLDHEQGPLVVKYLSEHPMEAEKLFSMSPMKAAVYINGNLAEKSKGSKPKTSKTPKPGKTLKGKGGTTKHSALEGALFE